MIQLLVLTLCVLGFSQDLESAKKAALHNNHAIAVTKFHLAQKTASPALKGKIRLETILSYLELAPNSSKYFDLAKGEIDSLLMKLEPEDSLYFPAHLLNAWTHQLRGEKEEARRLYEKSQDFGTRAEAPLNLWLGFMLYYQEDQERAELFKKILLENYPKSPAAGHLKTLNTAPSRAAEVAKPSKDQSATPTPQGFTLQLGAFGSKNNAENLAESYRPLNSPLESRVVKHSSKELYLVQITGFATKESAQKFAFEELRLPEGKYFILGP